MPVGQQVVLVDDSDIQNAGYNGTPWTTSSTGTDHQGYDYATHTAGTGANSFVWNLTIPQDGTYQVYAKYPSVSDAATNASYTVHDGSGGTASKTVNQSTGGGTWVSLGSYSFKRDSSGQQVTLSDNANGTVVADAVKLVRDNAGEADNEKTDFAYGYDPNGNLTDITDNSPSTKIDAYAVTYDGLNQVSKVEEKAAGSVKHTTTYTYNENGEPATRGHDDESAAYVYDDRDLVSKITDKATASDTSPKITSFTYTSRGQQDVETKGNGNTVDDDYFLDGSLQHQVEKKPNGTIVSEHTFSYDPNGNKSQDVAKKMNADNHAADLNTTTNWTYDPLDRIAQVTKTGASSDTETYVHDPNSNVVSQTIRGTTTTFNYDRNRLLTSATSGVTSSYNYDPFGRLDTVTSAGQVLERNTYDGFDHITENQKRNSSGALISTNYTYDPFDRTTSKTTDPGGANEKTTNYSYLGLSDQVLDEDVAGKITKSYQYSPWGERLSQVKTNTDGSKEDAYYGYNDHTDVETLTDSNGDTKATYGYTAYGQNDDAETTGIDKPDPQDPTKEPYNAYRFEAKRWDPNSSTYDMGFRDYDPGLNQFLARDTYNGALDDQNLTTDPFTGNRYAFSGGNPVGTVELDGHISWGDIGKAAEGVLVAGAETASAATDPSGLSSKGLDAALPHLGVDTKSGWYKGGYWGAEIASLFIGGEGLEAKGASLAERETMGILKDGIKPSGNVLNVAAGKAPEEFQKIADKLSKLPKTAGQVVDDARKPVGNVIRSGEDGLSSQIDEFLEKETDLPRPHPKALYTAAAHVEAKVAWALSKAPEVDHLDVIINNPTGPCQACRQAVGRILNPDQWINVWHPSGSGLKPFRLPELW